MSLGLDEFKIVLCQTGDERFPEPIVNAACCYFLQNTHNTQPIADPPLEYHMWSLIENIEAKKI